MTLPTRCGPRCLTADEAKQVFAVRRMLEIQMTREFIFQDFKQAFAFMSLCAQYAEELDHHPDWNNSWNRVLVHLSTHSMKALTTLDIEMAKAMDAFADKVMNAN